MAVEQDIISVKAEYAIKREYLNKLLHEVTFNEEKIDEAEYGVGTSSFQYDDPETYKEAISVVRDNMRELIRQGVAATCGTEWTVNGCAKKGKKLTKENIKVTLRVFNNECDAIIANVTWKNYDRSVEKLRKAYDFFNKYSASSFIPVSSKYLKLKEKELRLTYERQEKKQQIKEQQQEFRALQREEERFERDRLAAAKEE